MKTVDFDFELPEELIAQTPPTQRSGARLFVVHRNTKKREHKTFANICDFFGKNDVLVFNKSKVIPARIIWEKKEIFVSKLVEKNTWECLVRPGKKFKTGTLFSLPNGAKGEVKSEKENGLREIEFTFPEENFSDFLQKVGNIPLPPYMKRKPKKDDAIRYQTVFAEKEGSVAAPTAGLHFTKEILEKLQKKGVEIYFVTLHVGLGTFLPVKTDIVEEHEMHSEWYEIDKKTAKKINTAKKSGKKITAIGSTALRTLESAVQNDGTLHAGNNETNIFLYPPAHFKIVDHFFTNFHLPKSTLLMLVSAFAHPGAMDGKELVMQVYKEAIEKKYRFFSYGDATLWI